MKPLLEMLPNHIYCNECGKPLIKISIPRKQFDISTGEHVVDNWLECPALTQTHWWAFWKWMIRISSKHYGHDQIGVMD